MLKGDSDYFYGNHLLSEPSKLVAELIMNDVNKWSGDLIYELENERYDGSFWWKEEMSC